MRFFFFVIFILLPSPVHAAFHVGLLCLLTTIVCYSTHCDVCLSYVSGRPSWKRKDSGHRSPLLTPIVRFLSTFHWWIMAVFFFFLVLFSPFVLHGHTTSSSAYFCTTLPTCWFCKYCKMHFDIIDMFFDNHKLTVDHADSGQLCICSEMVMSRS